MSCLEAAPPARSTFTLTDGEVRRGVLAIAPMLVGYAPYAIVVGSVIATHGSRLAGWSGIWLIFGGSAHLATLRALDGGSVLLAVLTGVLVNARVVVYSASLAGHWQRQPLWFRLTAGALLIDPTWLAAENRAHEPGTPRDYRRFFLGAALTLALAWGVLVTVGMLIGSRLDGSIGLETAVPLCLLSLVAPRLLDRRSAPVVLTAGIVAACTTWLPAGSGLLVAIVAGAAVSQRRKVVQP